MYNIIEILIIQFLYAITLSCFAIAFTCILMDTDNLLHKYRVFLDWIDNDWITKPLGLCEKCFAGQLTLWSYVLIFQRTEVYTLFGHASVVLMTILFTDIIKRKYYN